MFNSINLLGKFECFSENKSEQQHHKEKKYQRFLARQHSDVNHHENRIRNFV